MPINKIGSLDTSFQTASEDISIHDVVTFATFRANYWPRMRDSDRKAVSVSQAWTDITAVIRGRAEVALYTNLHTLNLLRHTRAHIPTCTYAHTHIHIHTITETSTHRYTQQ
jgi:hypothetical protein